MVDAVNYSYIINRVNDEFDKLPISRVFFDSVDPISSSSMQKINSKINKHTIVGILFCQPSIKFVKDEILPSLDYLHHRSGDNINFFCCGYGAYWPPENENVVITIDGVNWSFDNKSFISIIEEFEQSTKWKYSGETELLLLDIIPSTNNKLNIKNAIVCNLELMYKDKAFTSSRAFFENLIRYFTNSENKSLLAYSDVKGISQGLEFLKNSILDNLPFNLKDLYNSTKSYAIKDIKK
ncbi:hypothetical protein ACOTVO_06425 [Aliarcobacter butzleri]